MAVVNPLTNSIQLLQDFGFFQVILPFILIYAIGYGILKQTKIFGDGETTVPSIVAFALAFFVIASTQVVEALSSFLPQASFLLVLTVLLLMTLSFFVGDFSAWLQGSPWISKGFVLAIILIFLGLVDVTLNLQIPIIHQLTLFMLGQSAVGIPGVSEQAVSTFLGLLLVLGIPVLVVYYMHKN